MTGQRAMALAKLFPEAAKGGRGKKNPVLNTGLSGGLLAHARTVLSVLPEIADQVLAPERILTRRKWTTPHC